MLAITRFLIFLDEYVFEDFFYEIKKQQLICISNPLIPMCQRDLNR